MTIRIGTSGWMYDHWRGDFYPQELPKRRWFEHYAGKFDTVELNSSFYRQPSAPVWDEWRQAAPDGFRFAVKANRFITHIKRLKGIEASVDRFLKGAERLGPALGPQLYQLPPNFSPDPENLDRLETFLRVLPERRQSVVEFRNDGWHTEETLALLRLQNVGFCCHDMRGLHPPLAVTSDVAYLRLHGNRYGGSYGPASLKKWAACVRDMEREADDVWVFFNNDLGGHAPYNAASLRAYLAV